jgi:hypothetical protein
MSRSDTEPARSTLPEQGINVDIDAPDDPEDRRQLRRGRADAEGDDGRGDLTLFLATVTAWMGATMAALVWLGSWSAEVYFVLSFHGFLGARLLFAPVRRSSVWWRVSNWVTYAGFAVLGYVVYTELVQFTA